MTILVDHPVSTADIVTEADDVSPPAVPPQSSRLQRAFRGRPEDPSWVRPSLLGLLIATAALYLWGLGASGWANAFYSSAVEAGAHSWKAMFFGSFDSSNYITVDKPPAALWVMDGFARIFGVNAWSILVPQALEGVATVALLYATVRRRFGAGAALLAGAAMALTPVATLMFRFNNPDALLTLLLVGSAYCMVRAIERAGTRWLVIAGALIGFGFLTKMLQAALVVPGFALVYLVCAPTILGRRIRQLVAGGVAMIVAAGWWVLAVSLVPAADRPYIGGSQHNSVIELILGYNGLGRLTGQESGSVGGAATASGRWGSTGLTRLFGSEMGGQISWLLPTALILTVVVLVASRRARRTDSGRAQVLLWASWLLVTGVTFSLSKGIIHPYYTVALAPAIAALCGIGAVVVWRRRSEFAWRLAASVTVAITASWSYLLLARSASWHPALRYAVLLLGMAAAVTLLLGSHLRHQAARRIAAVAAATTIAVSLAGPAAYSLNTAATAHSGSLPTAGPAVAGGMGMGGPGGAHGGGGAPPTGTTFGGQQRGTVTAQRGGPGGAGGIGGLLNASTPSPTLVTALRADASSYTWVAATIGSNNAAGLQLATGEPVMAIGGFNGTDPTPTLAAFEKLVAAGKVHYFIAGGTGGSSSSASAITSWVTSHFTAQSIGGQTVYDLTASTS